MKKVNLTPRRTKEPNLDLIYKVFMLELQLPGVQAVHTFIYKEFMLGLFTYKECNLNYKLVTSLIFEQESSFRACLRFAPTTSHLLAFLQLFFYSLQDQVFTSRPCNVLQTVSIELITIIRGH